MENVSLHSTATAGTGILLAGIIALVARATPPPQVEAPPLQQMDQIEASIAFKKPQQVQKPTSAPPPTVKPEGVSHDEKKTVEKKDEPKETPKNAKVDDKDPFKNFKHDDDSDNEVGKPTQDIGSFDGKDYGNAAETKGDPFYQGLLRDMDWEYPAILKGTETEPVGCLHITADGKIADVQIHVPSGDAQLDDSVERALKKVKKARDDKPEPVPTYLLKAATTKWVCFKFNLPK